ncbi:peroxiredoxin [Tardiphaga sp. 709]|uniref:peroxiredoxin n=1 Tax=unclassified Tardiphaga TaxID=2631404 RepID=UPI0028E23443|nr:redoxin domain-containing protein [Tardiphaga sp. 709]WNV10220.1 redoxin domain-containing protein [Tardiphaga sp. 709]
MAKKASKKPAKAAAKKTAKTASLSKAKKPAKAAAKSPAKKAAAKQAKPVAKAVSKALAKPAAKVAKAPVAKKAPATKTIAAKASPKAVAKPAPPSVAAPKATPEKIAPAPSVAAEGAKAPAFQLPRDGGATVSLSDYAGQKLVIFFYPRASTPGCTKEAIDFTRLSADFQAANAAVLGVSADPLKAQESFRDKFALGVPLLSDATQSMLKAYGAWGEKSMYGKTFEGVLRTTVLIDAKGNVAKIWRGVKVDGHADAVLEEARRI